MKFSKSKIIAALVMVSVLLFATFAKAQTGPTLISVTNQPAIVTTTATSNIVSWVKCNAQSGIGISWRFNQSGASTSNATINVYTSVDGTNIATVPFAQLTAPSTGTTDVIVNTNFDANRLLPYDSLIIGNIANTTALTTLTNKAIIIRRSPY